MMQLINCVERMGKTEYRHVSGPFLELHHNDSE